uniref:Uncharacterized protein n=1 Tax=Amphimedon queenslandica TaxID=400682 RepID=A0A1X7T3U2_AMPQE
MASSPAPSLNSTEDYESDVTIDSNETQAILPLKLPTRPKRIRNLPAHITKASVVQPSVKHTTENSNSNEIKEPKAIKGKKRTNSENLAKDLRIRIDERLDRIEEKIFDSQSISTYSLTDEDIHSDHF